MNEPRVELVLALADDDLMVGHRHSEWTGWAPVIEADLAFSSIAQDEIAHAQLLYSLIGDPDALALGRHPDQYRHAIVCERPNGGPGTPHRVEGGGGDWAYAIARQLLYDTADDVRLEALQRSAWDALAHAATVIRLEEHYHLEHARLWLRDLAATDLGRRRLAGGLDAVAREALALFESLPGEEQLLADGTLPVPTADLRRDWRSRVTEVCAAAGLDEPAWGLDGMGGRTGLRSDDFEPLWEDLTGLYRAHAGATW